MIWLFALACSPRPAPAGVVSASSPWFPLEPGRSLCLPTLPGEPASNEVREGLQGVGDALRRGDLDGAAERLGALPPEHPAVAAHHALFGLLIGDSVGAGSLAALSERFPSDPCLAASASVGAAAVGDLQSVTLLLTRARFVAPEDPEIAFLAWFFGTEPPEGLMPVLEAGLRAAPQHPAFNLAVGLEMHAHNDPSALSRLQASVAGGMPEAAGVLMALYRKGGQRIDYLRLASQVGLLGDEGRVSAAPDAERALADLLGLGAGEVRVATIQTSEGDLRCTLFPDVAPVAVSVFAGLADGSRAWLDPRTGLPGQGALYDDTHFHRVIPAFMVQAGDPLGDGTGGPGFRYPDEVDDTVRFDRAGRLALANSGPNTNGSQFFVTGAPTPHLDLRHTIFGQCDAASLEVAARIAAVPRDPSDKPIAPVVLRHVALERVAATTPR